MLRSVDFKAKTRGEESTAAFRPLGEPRKSSWRLKLRKVKLQMNCTRGKKKLIQLEDARQVKASFVSVCMQPSPARTQPLHDVCPLVPEFAPLFCPGLEGS